ALSPLRITSLLASTDTCCQKFTKRKRIFFVKKKAIRSAYAYCSYYDLPMPRADRRSLVCCLGDLCCPSTRPTHKGPNRRLESAKRQPHSSSVSQPHFQQTCPRDVNRHHRYTILRTSIVITLEAS